MIYDNQSQQDNQLEQNVSNSSSNPSQNKGILSATVSGKGAPPSQSAQFEEELEKTLRQLEKLQTASEHLRDLAMYSKLVLQKTSESSPAVIQQPLFRKLAPLGESATREFDPFAEPTEFDCVALWKVHCYIPENVNLPPSRSQWGSAHWAEVQEVAWLLYDSVWRVFYPKVERQNLYEVSPETKPNWNKDVRSATAIKYLTDALVFARSSFKIGVLARDLDSLFTLVRLVASQCIMMGDFSVSREPHSSAKLTYIGTLLYRIADELAGSFCFFYDYSNEHPADIFSLGQMNAIGRFFEVIEGKSPEDAYVFSPPVIAASIGRGVDFVRSRIKEMMCEGLLDKQEPSTPGGRVKMTFNEKDAMKIIEYCQIPFLRGR